MADLYDYLKSLPANTKLSDLPASLFVTPERSSFEAAQPVAQAPERKRSWGGKPVDTRALSYSRQTNTPFEARQAAQELFETPKGVVEGALNVGSGMVAAPAAGLAGMYELGTTGDLSKATQRIGEVAQGLTYEPRTKSGKAYAEMANKPLEWYGKAAEGMGEVGEEYYGIPKDYTTAFLQAAPVALGGLKTAFPKEYAMGMNKLAQGAISPMTQTFAGVKAKNAPLGLLKKAEQMAAEGIPDAQIWSETGWTKGFADKQWRWEIPDNEMKAIYNADEIYRPREYYQKEARRLSEAQDALANDFKQGKISKEPATAEFRRLKGLQDAAEQKANEYYLHGAGTATRMGEEIPFEQAFRHDQLKQAYGDLPTVSFTDRLPFEGSGSYSQGRIQTSLLNDPAEATMAHELQHAVQEREGFARGGSPGQFLDEISTNQAKVIAARIERGEQPSEAIRWVRENLGWWPDSQTIDLAMKDKGYLNKLGSTPEESYRALAGEAEARLTANRMNLTPEQRRAQYPISEFDVPVEQQIVRGVPGAVEQAYAKMRDPKSKAMLERQYPELKEASKPVIIGPRSTDDVLLRPAIKHGEIIGVASPKETHYEAAANLRKHLGGKSIISEESGRGWVTPDGHFLSATDAGKWLKENHPSIYRGLKSPAGGLESLDYHQAIGVFREGEEALNDLLRMRWR